MNGGGTELLVTNILCVHDRLHHDGGHIGWDWLENNNKPNCLLRMLSYIDLVRIAATWTECDNKYVYNLTQIWCYI